MQMQAGPPLLNNTAGWGVSLDWTEEEQRTLEACMIRFPAERIDPVQRYLRIAATLPRKSVRDVALRVRWTTMQAQLKRPTGVDPKIPGMSPLPGGQTKPTPIPMITSMHGGGVNNTGGAAAAAAAAPMAMTMAPPPSSFMPPSGPPAMADGSATVDGPITHLLDANLAILNHFRSNMAAFKVHENTQLLVQFRDNILQILQAMKSMGGVMSEMPHLPVRLNLELANSFLPSRPAGILSYDGNGMMLPPPPQPALNVPGMVPINGPGTFNQGTNSMTINTAAAAPLLKPQSGPYGGGDGGTNGNAMGHHQQQQRQGGGGGGLPQQQQQIDVGGGAAVMRMRPPLPHAGGGGGMQLGQQFHHQQQQQPATMVQFPPPQQQQQQQMHGDHHVTQSAAAAAAAAADHNNNHDILNN